MSEQIGQPRPDAGPQIWPKSSAEILDHGSAELPQAHRRRWPIVAGAAVTLAVGGAGIALGMALSGGGTQPEDVLPAAALVYADIDLDPGAEQKVNMLRLLNKFPAVSEALGDRSDVTGYFVDQLLGESGELRSDEVTPWVGDRAGVALLWDENAGAPVLAVALQVTDEDLAERALSDLSESDFAFGNGYVVVTSGSATSSTPGMKAAEVLEQSTAASLADDDQFKATMAPLGTGLASIYVDGDAVAKVLERELGTLGMPRVGSFGLGTDALGGQIGAVLRAEPSTLEVVGRSTQASTAVDGGTTELFATLPSTTTAALAVAGGGDAVAAQWEALSQQLKYLGQIPEFTGGRPDQGVAALEETYNIRLPDDLVTLFGDDMVVAVDGAGLIGSGPAVGIRTLTDPVAAADLANRLQPVIDDVTAGFGVTVRAVDDGLVVASSGKYAEQLAAGDGGLMENPHAVAALPDVGQASMVLWVDLESISGFAGLLDPGAAATLDPLEGLGVTAGQDDGGTFFRARLTFAGG